MENHVSFRFYEKLNDFLPLHKKKVTFVHSFFGNRSVKDVIESLGVPHTEVDLILVNSEPVDFKYLVKNNDFVSVYPVFESLNISQISPLREKPLRESRFILDVHLGKLAKYLRMLGFDTLYQNNYDDPEIINISLAENRIILTRDLGLLKVKTVTHGYFIRNQIPKAQVIEVLNRFDLFKSIDSFIRCVKCNGKLEPVEKEELIERLEPLTKRYFNKFYRCDSCRSIYWEGSHFERIKEFIEDILLFRPKHFT